MLVWVAQLVTAVMVGCNSRCGYRALLGSVPGLTPPLKGKIGLK